MKMLQTVAFWIVAVLTFVPCYASVHDEVQPAGQVIVRVENPLPLAREDEVVALDWAELRTHLPALGEANVRVRDAASEQEVITQLFDEDADGQPDELLFLVSLWPNETRSYAVEAAPSALEPEARVYVRHDEERDDVAWESDRIAFRAYGQGLWQASAYEPLVSSGIDVWPKRVRDLILERWYAEGHDAYHLDTGEGADFFSVGPTLGAGGTAIWRDGQLYRAENFASYRIIANGPIRAVFELIYEPWMAGDIEVEQVKRITIDAGQNLFREESTFSKSTPEALPYVVGFVERSGSVGSMSRAQPWAWLSLWGPVERTNGGHGALGIAVLLPEDRLEAVREAAGHYLAVTAATPGEPVTHYIGAGWTASGDFDTVEDWWTYLDTFAQRLNAPLQVILSPASEGSDN